MRNLSMTISSTYKTSIPSVYDYMYGLLRGLFWKYFADFPYWTQRVSIWEVLQLKSLLTAIWDRYFPETKVPCRLIKTVLVNNKFSEHTDCLRSIDRY